MKKLPGVEEVHVSLEKAHTDIRFRPGNTITLAQLREIIKNSGFKPGQAEITALGRLVDDKGQLTLDLAPAKASLLLQTETVASAAVGEARRLAATESRLVEVTGTVVSGDSLRLKSISVPAK